MTAVLSRLAGVGLKINPKKCKLLADKVTVLGHVVSREGISTDPEKVIVVQEWPAPSNISLLRSFLGTAGYYRHFVPKYADLAAPLYRVEQKGKNWEWTQGCHEAFLNIKRQLANAPILAFPRLDTLFILDTDASDSGIGGVLSQLQDGRERVIAYAARGLSKSERNYSTARKELLALVWGAEHFEIYLCGKTFVARTDHKALRWLKNFKNPKGQIARWLERLSDFDIKVEHRTGSSHGNADGLSRIPWDEEVAFVHSVETHCLSRNQIKVEQERDPVLSQVSKWLRAGERPPRKDVEGSGRELLSYWAQLDRLAYKDELIWRRWEEEGIDNVLCVQLCISRKLAPQILRELHDSPSSGHMGVTRTIARVRERFHWFGLRDDVENHVRACAACAQTNGPSRLPRAPLISVKALHPLQKVAIDIIGPQPRSSSRHEWLLVVSDYFTKFAQAYPVRNTASVTLANRVMDEYIGRFGCFESLHSD